VPEVNIDLVTGREKRILAPHPSALEHRRSLQGGTSRNHEDAYQQKNKLAEGSGGYRTRTGYKRVNQSTSNLQMSSALSNFSSPHVNSQRRLRKANAVLYEKNVLEGRLFTQKKEEAKYDPKKWSYSTTNLWANLAGKDCDPNIKNRRITGCNYEPAAAHRSQKLKEMSS